MLRLKVTSKLDSTWVQRFIDLDLMINGDYVKIDSESFCVCAPSVKGFRGETLRNHPIPLAQIASIELEEYEPAIKGT